MKKQFSRLASVFLVTTILLAGCGEAGVEASDLVVSSNTSGSQATVSSTVQVSSSAAPVVARTEWMVLKHIETDENGMKTITVFEYDNRGGLIGETIQYPKFKFDADGNLIDTPVAV